MSSSFEDDNRLPLPGERGVATGAPSVAEETDTVLPWGVVGRVQAREAGKGVCEVVRDRVGGDVHYRPPALPLGWQWLPGPSGGEPFSLSRDGLTPHRFSSEELAAFRTLEAFRAASLDAWKAPPGDPRKEPALEALDRVIESLLDLTARLHRHGAGLGLTIPVQFLLYSSAGQQEVFPCDLGFVYERSSEFGALPVWLNEAGPVRAAWGGLLPGPLLELHRSDGSEEADLRKVVRLIDWLLTGQARAHVPASADQDSSTRAPVWEILRDAEDKVESAEALRDQLRASRPSDHFRPAAQPKKPGPKAPAHALVYLAAIALVVGALGLVWHFYQPPAGTDPSGDWRPLIGQVPPGPGRPAAELPPASRLRERVEAYEGAPKEDLHKRLDALLAAYRTPPSDRPDVARREAEYLLYLRRDFADLLDRRMQQQIERSENRHLELLDAVGQVKQIEKDFLVLAQYPALAQSSDLEKEKSCLAYCQLWLAGQPPVE
jgi:hypothetical protein